MDMKIFVDTDSDIRLARRLKRDIMERARDIEGVLHQYNKFVKPAFEHYIEPTMSHADIIVPRGEDKYYITALLPGSWPGVKRLSENTANTQNFCPSIFSY